MLIRGRDSMLFGWDYLLRSNNAHLHGLWFQYFIVSILDLKFDCSVSVPVGVSPGIEEVRR